jgi:H+-translocating NAD(P) transhydrogenase subunit alpha
MLLLQLYVFVLAAFLGFQIISRVPPLLHTPLMAATNAISGISLVGSLVAAGADHNRLATILGFTAVVCATMNVVGGFLITDRMLGMFKREAGGGRRAGARGSAAGGEGVAGSPSGDGRPTA